MYLFSKTVYHFAFAVDHLPLTACHISVTVNHHLPLFLLGTVYHLSFTVCHLPLSAYLPLRFTFFTVTYDLPFTFHHVPLTICRHLPVTFYYLAITVYHVPFTTVTCHFLYRLPFTSYHYRLQLLPIYQLSFTVCHATFTVYLPLPFDVFQLPFTVYRSQFTVYLLPLTNYHYRVPFHSSQKAAAEKGIWTWRKPVNKLERHNRKGQPASNEQSWLEHRVRAKKNAK